MRAAAPRAAWRLLAVIAHTAIAAAAAAAAGGDAASLVQGPVWAHLAREEEDASRPAFPTSDAVRDTPDGPIANTSLGPVLGRHSKVGKGNDCFVFRGVPYAEPPGRFAKPKPKKPWGPKALEAREFRPPCIGSGIKDVEEAEDCLHLNIWLPLGAHKDMPVIVYLHGGMNQHGAGHEPQREGDLVVQSAQFPVIYVTLDFRLGIFGWIDMEDRAMPKNLGMRDQQLALRWINRHIAAFGGDPGRVTLMGHSEGAGAVIAHLAAPGSRGLFQRASLQSPPADFFSRDTDRLRTDFMLRRLKCKHHRTAQEVIDCLARRDAQKIWRADWVVQELSKDFGSLKWLMEFGDVLQFLPGTDVEKLPGYLGWHPVVDGDVLPGEPRELIARGDYERVQVLITSTRNESIGAFNTDEVSQAGLMESVEYLLKAGDAPAVVAAYAESLRRDGFGLPARDPELMLALTTDKVWFCEILSLARDLAATGSDVRVGMFEHAPRWDPNGRQRNPLCEKGATCHSADMLYILPQESFHGGIPEDMHEDFMLARAYRDEVLQFVSGGPAVWVPFANGTEPVTFRSSAGSRVVEGYRREQCRVLDSSMGEALPGFMRRRAAGAA